MDVLQRLIENYPESLILNNAGHFVQEWDEDITKTALTSLEDMKNIISLAE